MLTDELLTCRYRFPAGYRQCWILTGTDWAMVIQAAPPDKVWVRKIGEPPATQMARAEEWVKAVDLEVANQVGG